MDILAQTERFNQTDIQNELRKTGVAHRNITPSPNFLNILESAGYTIDQALKDIIDNSIDAESSNILLTIGSENKKPYVIISDDGCGMQENTLFGALVLGAAEPELGDKNKNGGSLGKYGTGLKAAIASFRGKTTILTKERGGQLLKVNYNKEIIQKQWEDTNEWGIQIYLGTPEDQNFFNKETNNSEHGTVIKIYDIDRYKVSNNKNLKSRMKQDLGKTFRRFIHNGNVKFKVNNKEIFAFDPCGHNIPFKYDGKSYTSEIMNELEFDNLEYIDSNGNKKRNGHLKYTSYLLPQLDVIDEGVHDSDGNFIGKNSINKKLEFTIRQQGISVMRTNREIQSTGWLGLAVPVPQLTRFRVEVDFDGEMDSEWNVDFKKTSVDPSSYILDQIRTQFEADAARARREYVKVTKSKAGLVPTKLKNIVESFSNFLKRQEKLIPRLPGRKVRKVPPTRKRGGTKPPPRSPRTVTEKVHFTYRDDMFGSKWYESHTINSQKRTIELQINMNHPMYDYIKNIDKPNGIVWMLNMYTHHFGKQDALQNASTGKEREILLNHFNTVEEKMGDMLAKLYPLTPKV